MNSKVSSGGADYQFNQIKRKLMCVPCKIFCPSVYVSRRHVFCEALSTQVDFKLTTLALRNLKMLPLGVCEVFFILLVRWCKKKNVQMRRPRQSKVQSFPWMKIHRSLDWPGVPHFSFFFFSPILCTCVCRTPYAIRRTALRSWRRP